MLPETIYLFISGLFILFYTYRLIPKGEDLKPYLKLAPVYVFFSLIFLVSNATMLLLGLTALFIFCYFYSYGWDMLPGIDEISLLFYTLLFWGLFLSTSGTNAFYDQKVLIILALIPTFIVLYLSLTIFRPDWSICALLYMWFIGIQVYLIVTRLQDIVNSGFGSSVSEFSIYGLFLIMSTMMLMFNLGLYSIVLPKLLAAAGKKDHPWAFWMLDELSDKLSGKQIRKLYSFALIVLVGGSLFMCIYKTLPVDNVINFWITAYSILQSSGEPLVEGAWAKTR